MPGHFTINLDEGDDILNRSSNPKLQLLIKLYRRIQDQIFNQIQSRKCWTIFQFAGL